MKIEITDSKVVLDGVTYRKEETLPSEPKFKVGMWVIIKPYNKHFPQRITRVDQPYFWVDNEYDGWLFRDSNGLYNLRLATSAEIEAHLIKEAEKKGFKKGVKYKDNSFKPSIFEFPSVVDFKYSRFGYDTFDCGEGMGWIYHNGLWATVLPSKKPIPKTRKEFEKYNTEWSEFWLKAPTGSKHKDDVVRFLDQYDFND